MTKRRTNNEQSHEHERVAANGLLHRRVLPAGQRRHGGRGRSTRHHHGAGPDHRRGLAALDAEAGRAILGLWHALALAHQYHPHPRRGHACARPRRCRLLAHAARTCWRARSRPPACIMSATTTASPDIDPDKHELMIHGMVRQPLVFNLNSLLRYPMETRVHYRRVRGQFGRHRGRGRAAAGERGRAAWPALLLGMDGREALGAAAGSRARSARDLDSSPKAPTRAGMSRSFPVWKANDDAMIALYQNGEPIRPEQGFPMRVLLPGFQGNTNVKWVRRIKVIDGPMHTRDETSRYSELMPDGKARAVHAPVRAEIGDPEALVRHDDAGRRAITRSPASPGRAPDACAASMCRPTAARAGRKPRSPAPCSRRR